MRVRAFTVSALCTILIAKHPLVPLFVSVGFLPQGLRNCLIDVFASMALGVVFMDTLNEIIAQTPWDGIRNGEEGN